MQAEPVKLNWDNLVIEQPKIAQKITSDVADIVFQSIHSIPQDAKIIELGSGSGILSFIVENKIPSAEILAIDIQPELVDLAKKNKVIIGSQVNFIEQDIREIRSKLMAQNYDFLLSNPPHLPVGEYRISPNELRAISRNEIKCNMNDILDATTYLLKDNGKALLIYPQERDKQLVTQLKKIDLYLQKRIFTKEKNNKNRMNKRLIGYILGKEK